MQSILRAPQLQQHGFSHGFSLRHGGVSEGPFDSLNLGRSVGDDPARVAENLRRFAGWVGYEPDALFELSQVHGRVVRRVRPGPVNQGDRGEHPSAVRQESGDALVASGGAVIGVRTADCVPVLLADPITRQVAAVHAGWRGVAAGVVDAAVLALCEAASAPASRLIAAIFPHIRGCCFEVGEDVAAQLGRMPHGETFVQRSFAKPHVALAGLVSAQLAAAGIPRSQSDDVPGCTRCEPERFFSFRRDGQASGRHLTVIVAG